MKRIMRRASEWVVFVMLVIGVTGFWAWLWVPAG